MKLTFYIHIKMLFIFWFKEWGGLGISSLRNWVFVRLFIAVTNIREKQLKGGKIYFGSHFQRLQSMVSWLNCFYAQGKVETLQRKDMAEERCLPLGSQETKRVTGRGQGQDTQLKGILPVQHLLQIGSTFLSFTTSQ
jgi:hypothetical protein